MRVRPLGKTGIDVPELCLGTWGLSGDGYGPVEEAEQDLVIERALALGVKAFETADAYGKGEMESRLGRLLEKNEEAVVITKVGTDRAATPPAKNFDADYLKQAIEKSRERLKRKIDVVLLHNPSTVALGKDKTREVLDQLVKDEVIRAWGVSAGNAEIGRKALQVGAQVLQVAYSCFHQKDFNGVLEYVKDHKAGLLVRSVLVHGLLCGQWPTTKTFPTGDHRRDRWTTDELKKRISQLSALRPSVSGTVTSMRAAALRYALDEPDISAVVIGPRSTQQLDQLVRDAGKEPPYLPVNTRNALHNRLSTAGIKW
jgi:aryl-alcohol dehydrogenase-like predicted oxidoreductase